MAILYFFGFVSTVNSHVKFVAGAVQSMLNIKFGAKIVHRVEAVKLTWTAILN